MGIARILLRLEICLMVLADVCIGPGAVPILFFGRLLASRRKPSMKIKIQNQFIKRIRIISPAELVEKSLEDSVPYYHDELSKLQARHSRLTDIVGEMLECLIRSGSVSEGDLKKMFDYGDLETLDIEHDGPPRHARVGPIRHNADLDWRRRLPVPKQIRAYFKDNPDEPMTAEELFNEGHIFGKLATIQSKLNLLCREGYLERVSPGLYRLSHSAICESNSNG